MTHRPITSTQRRRSIAGDKCLARATQRADEQGQEQVEGDGKRGGRFSLGAGGALNELPAANSGGSASSVPPPPPVSFFLVLPDGSCAPATARTCRIVMKQARSEAHKQARIRRLEKAAELQSALEDRAAARRLHQELAEIERDRMPIKPGSPTLRKSNLSCCDAMLRYNYRKQRSEDQRPWIPKPSELPPDWRERGAPHYDWWIVGTDLSAQALAARLSSLRRIWMSRRITRNSGNGRAADHRKDHVASTTLSAVNTRRRRQVVRSQGSPSSPSPPSKSVPAGARASQALPMTATRGSLAPPSASNSTVMSRKPARSR